MMSLSYKKFTGKPMVNVNHASTRDFPALGPRQNYRRTVSHCDVAIKNLSINSYKDAVTALPSSEPIKFNPHPHRRRNENSWASYNTDDDLYVSAEEEWKLPEEEDDDSW